MEKFTEWSVDVIIVGFGDELLPFNVTMVDAAWEWVVGCGVALPDEVCWGVGGPWPWLWLLLPPPRPPLLR